MATLTSNNDDASWDHMVICLIIYWKFGYCQFNQNHYSDVIMSTTASQITDLTIVYWTVYSRRRSKETSKLHVTGLCEGNSPVTGEFPSQRASDTENVSIWWRHHEQLFLIAHRSCIAGDSCDDGNLSHVFKDAVIMTFCLLAKLSRSPVRRRHSKRLMRSPQN